MKPLSLISLILVAASLSIFDSLQAEPVHYTTTLGSVGFYAVESGDFSSYIWRKDGSDVKDKKKIVKELPQPQDQACIGKDGVTVTVSKPVKITSWLHRANKGVTVWKSGGAMETITFYGVRGAGAVGTYSMLEGGTLTVTGVMHLAGQTLEDSSTGVFNQSGGTVHLTEFPLALTGANTLSNSTAAVGVYNLSGGTLNILAKKSRPGATGILNGVGKGAFNWTGGILNANRLSEGLVNGGGKLSPGGEGAVGETLLDSETARTYTQKTLGALAVDIGAASKFDRLVWTAKNGSATVVFERGSKIAVHLVGGYKPNDADVFPVVVADNIKLEGSLQIVGPAGRDFSYEIGGENGKAELRLVYTPGRGGSKLAQ